MKKVFGVIVAIIILMISSVVFQLTKAILKGSEFGQNMYESYGRIGILPEVILGMLPLIIGVWLVKLSWKKITYEEPTVESPNNKDANASLAKAVYNHTKDIAAEVKPAIDEYKQKHAISQTQVQNGNVDNANEDEIYEQVMLEIEEDRKIKSTWAKALAQSDGDKDRTEALYIKLRVQNIIEATEEEKLKNSESEKIKTETDSIKTEEEKKEIKKSEKNLLVTLLPFTIGGVVLMLFLLNIINKKDEAQTPKQLIKQITTPQIQQKNISTNSQEQSDEKTSKKLSEIGILYPLDTFTVNLKRDAGQRSLKVTISLELNSMKLGMELDNKSPVIRDRIVRILTSKTIEEISSKKGRQKVAEQIIDTLNSIITDGSIKGIYFTEFVIQ